MVNRTEQVNAFMRTLDHPLKEGIESVRSVILSVDEGITEHIKWNAPSFCYNGDDRITFRLGPKNIFQIVFHRGAKVKKGDGFSFEDSTGLLEWLAPDRAIVKLRDMDDVKANEASLAMLAGAWMQATG